MSDISFSTTIERSVGGGANVELFVNYDIPGYYDPEDGEYFGATDWYATEGAVGSPPYALGSGQGDESNSVDLGLGLFSDATLGNYAVDFAAENSFSGDSVSQHINVLSAANATTPQTIVGTSGVDIEIGGSGDDVLSGLGDNDVLDGGDGNDMLNGGAGNDQLDGGAGTNILTGGGGDDSYTVSSPTDTIVELPGGGYDTVYANVSYTLPAEVERLDIIGGGKLNGTGNSGDNRIDGNGYDNVLSGLAGNDQIYGNGGNDTLIGGDDNDVLDGGTGNDTMTGGAGDDTYYVDSYQDQVIEAPNAGDDTVRVSGIAVYTLGANVNELIRDGGGDFHGIGNSQINHITGGTGNDRLDGLGGNDTLTGGAGNDILDGGAGADKLIGGDGSDTASYVDSAGAVTVNLALLAASGGDAAGDTFNSIENVTGTALADKLTGDIGANILNGGGGNDTLVGGNGDDTLIGGAGADVLSGGQGNDTVSYAGSAAVNVNLATLTVSGGDADGDVISGFENIGGSDFGDILTGDVNANTISGRGGNDTIDGGQGDDTIIGGAGADTMIGGSGSDTLSYLGSVGGVTIDLHAGTAAGGDAAGDIFSGFQNVTGSDQADMITGDGNANVLKGAGGNDTIDGGGGNDTIVGGLGADTLVGGDGIDIVSYAGSSTGVYVNLGTNYVSYGDAEGDTISGFESIGGSSFGDSLYGDDNGNVIAGQGGDDVIDGGGGNDTLYGGGGVDTFSYGNGYSTTGSGHDVVMDFTTSGPSADVLELRLGGAFDTYSEVMAVSKSSGSNGQDTTFRFDASGSITLSNVSIASLTPGNIIFG